MEPGGVRHHYKKIYALKKYSLWSLIEYLQYSVFVFLFKQVAGASFRGPLLNHKNPILLLLGNNIVVFRWRFYITTWCMGGENARVD